MNLRISRHALRTAALLTLLLPGVLFLLTWVKPIIALPSAAAALFAFWLYARKARSVPLGRDAFGAEEDAFTLPLLPLLAVIACALLWTFFSGIGGCFYQNEDHYGRNAILHDLLNHSWPVYFEGTPYALTYYLAYWIVPALVGKAASAVFGSGALWAAANAALFLQTVWFLVLTFVLLLSLVRARGLFAVCLSLLVFVLFSGMDVLMGSFNSEAWNHQVEWWAGTYQYSSLTTDLFWVYNQAVPAFLATMLLLSRPWDIGSYALIGLCAMPYSPMPFIGLMVCFVGLALFRLALDVRAQGLRGVRMLLARCLTARNLLACVGLAPCFCLYFMANSASSDAPLRLETYAYAYGPLLAFTRLLLFALVEFGAFFLVMGRRFDRDPLFMITQLALLFIPWFRVGYSMDFSMRASIPGLVLMAVYAIRFLLEGFSLSRDTCRYPGAGRFAAAMLALLLLIGAGTPLLEFERGVYKVKTAGTIFLTADPFGTVLHEDANTYNFICSDVSRSAFYRYLAR